jgi:lysophospholipase L1-like esterase
MLTVTKFVAFGDSLTEGTVSPLPTVLIKLMAEQTYPFRLQSLLAARYTAQVPTVVNRGKAGEYAEDAVSRFVDMLRGDSPEAVLLLEGVNDLSNGGTRGASRALSALDSMMREARNRRVQMFLATLPPERPGTPHTLDDALLARFNDDVRRLARGENAELVDLAVEFDPNLIGADGLHPSEQGYARLAEIFFNHIKASKEAPPAAFTGTR